MSRSALTPAELSRGGRLGRRIALERQRLGFTQAGLATKAGVTLQALLKVEQGHVGNPGVFSIASVAEALDVPMEKLINGAVRGVGPTISTLGYEGLDASQFLARLRDMGAESVVDVRMTPLSRKPGLSKTKLGDAIEAMGMEYRHERALGNPKENRVAFTGEDLELGRERFRALLGGQAAREALLSVAALAASRHTVLICFEKDATRCHRAVVVEELAQLG